MSNNDEASTSSAPPKKKKPPKPPPDKEPPPPERLHLVKRTVVVKKCLLSALSPDLPSFARDNLLDLIDKYSELISRMTRRASLMFLYYVIRSHEDNVRLPDFENDIKDSYWHAWLRAGLQEFGDELPSPAFASYFKEIKHLVGTTITGGAPSEIPLYFDRVLGHAATTLKTIVINNQNVHFIEKLKRLCKYMAIEEGHRGLTAIHVLTAVRRNVCRGGCRAAWSDSLVQFVKDVREKLGLADGVVLYDDTEIDIVTRFDFGWWLQTRFAELEERKIMLSPVVRVSRMHVRLDATTLFMLRSKITEPPAPEDPRTKPPTAKQHPDPEDLRRAQEAHARNKALRRTPDFKERMAEYEERLREYKELHAAHSAAFPSYGEFTKDKPVDPTTELNQRLPKKFYGRRPKDASDAAAIAAWELERAEALQRDLERDEDRASAAYKQRQEAYSAYELSVQRFGMKIFKPFKDKSSKHGWVPSGSVSTDGVSISIAYEREALEPLVPKGKKAKNLRRSDVYGEPDPRADAYDPDASTVVGDTLVLGIDPGRTHIVTVICIDKKGKRHEWHLSRGQYYAEGGVHEENRRQRRRHRCMQADFQSIADAGGALRASSSKEVLKYLQAYAGFEAKWWTEVALKRAESRGKMRRYIGKHRVLAGFFGKLRRDAFNIAKESGMGVKARVEVAYGAAGTSFKSTGVGEAAVPTKGAYRECELVFGRDNVKQECEDNTSKRSWNSKRLFHIAFKRPNPRGAGHQDVLDHTSARCPPLLQEADAERVAKSRLRDKNKGIVRRGGRARVAELEPEDEDQRVVKSERRRRLPRYIECRGLRFCPERRMYFDRDEASARAIAGLRCLRLEGLLGRPMIFRVKRL